jgi:SAM-dependent methyltransferase
LNTLASRLTRDPRGFWAAPEQTAVSYPERSNDCYFNLEDSSFWFRHRNRVLVHLARTFPPPGPLADVGGGNGFVSCALEQAGFPTILVEPGPGGVRNACARGLRNVVWATLETAGFQPQSLPAVGLFDVLEHIEDDRAFLATVGRLIRPGGRLYLTVPAYRFLWSAEDTETGHYRRYTLPSLSARLREAGFAVEYASYFFGLLPVPVFLLRTVPSLLGIRRSTSDETTQREHAAGKGLLGRLADRLFDAELAWLRAGRRLPVGGSCVVVARRPAQNNVVPTAPAA